MPFSDVLSEALVKVRIDGSALNTMSGVRSAIQSRFGSIGSGGAAAFNRGLSGGISGTRVGSRMAEIGRVASHGFSRGFQSAPNPFHQMVGQAVAAGNQFSSIGKMAAGYLTGGLALAGVNTLAGGITGLFRQVFTLNAGLEQSRTSFEVMLGSAAAAEDVISRLRKFAAETPFEMPELNEVSRGLLTFGERGDQLMETLTILGNAASGTSSDFGMIGLIFNQIRGVGKLLTQDFRQLSTRGVLFLSDIAKHYKVTDEEAQSMISNGKVGFEDVRKILIGLSAEGGRFHNMMQKQSKTFSGLGSTIRDNFGTALMNAGKPLFDLGKVGLENLVKFFDSPSAAQWVERISSGLTRVIDIIKSALGNETVVAIGKFALLGSAGVAAVMGIGTAFGVVSAVVGTIFSPMTLAISGLAMLAASFKSAMSGPDGEKMRATMVEIKGLAVEIGRNVMDVVVPAFQRAGEIVGAMFGSETQSANSSFWMTALEGVKGFLDLVSVLTTNWSATWDFMKSYSLGTILNLRDRFAYLFDVEIPSFVASIVEGTVAAGMIIADRWREIWGGLVESLKTLFTGLIDAQIARVTLVGDALAKFFEGIKAGKIGTSLVDLTSDVIKSQTDANAKVGQAIIDAGKVFSDTAGDALGSAGKEAADAFNRTMDAKPEFEMSDSAKEAFRSASESFEKAKSERDTERAARSEEQAREQARKAKEDAEKSFANRQKKLADFLSGFLKGDAKEDEDKKSDAKPEHTSLEGLNKTIQSKLGTGEDDTQKKQLTVQERIAKATEAMAATAVKGIEVAVRTISEGVPAVGSAIGSAAVGVATGDTSKNIGDIAGGVKDTGKGIAGAAKNAIGLLGGIMPSISDAEKDLISGKASEAESVRRRENQKRSMIDDFFKPSSRLPSKLLPPMGAESYPGPLAPPEKEPDNIIDAAIRSLDIGTKSEAEIQRKKLNKRLGFPSMRNPDIVPTIPSAPESPVAGKGGKISGISERSWDAPPIVPEVRGGDEPTVSGGMGIGGLGKFNPLGKVFKPPVKIPKTESPISPEAVSEPIAPVSSGGMGFGRLPIGKSVNVDIGSAPAIESPESLGPVIGDRQSVSTPSRGGRGGIARAASNRSNDSDRERVVSKTKIGQDNYARQREEIRKRFQEDMAMKRAAAAASRRPNLGGLRDSSVIQNTINNVKDGGKSAEKKDDGTQKKIAANTEKMATGIFGMIDGLKNLKQGYAE